MKIKQVLFGGLAAALGAVSLPASAEAPHWTHEEQAHWGALEDASQTEVPLMYPYAECAIGKHQSPVDLASTAKTNLLNRPRPAYLDDTPDFFNSGHAIQVNSSSGYQGELLIGNDRYPLIQYHFHAPGEHVMGRRSFAGELHYVHVRPDGKMAVLGVLIEEGAANPGFQTILDHMPAEEGAHDPDSGVSLNPASLLPGNLKHFHTYAGSLTTPPCSEGISWYVLAEPITLSAGQIAALEGWYEHNNRLPQALNGRVVTRSPK